jgi:ligand-binding SRPBCC domain-containing protein
MTKLYTLERVQRLPVSLKEAWAFFSSPKNLSDITPDYMGFGIISGNEDVEIYPGMIITYRITPLLGIPMKWVTEISHADRPHYFVDEQRIGPYSLWHHEHHFREIEGGVEMTDRLFYQMPYGLVGKCIHYMIVGRRVKHIFDYRYSILEEKFGKLSIGERA